MKLRKELIIFGVLISSSFASFASSNEASADKKDCETKVAITNEADTNNKACEPTAGKEYTDEQKSMFLKVFGYTLGMQGGLRNFGLNKDEVSSFLDGIKLSAEGGDAPFKFGEYMEDVQAYLQQKAAAYADVRKEEVKAIYEKNNNEGKEFLANLSKTNQNIKKTDSGLYYEISAAGSDSVKPTEQDNVEITYVGKFINGSIFDQSEGKSITFPLQSIIAGLKEGILLLGKGGRGVFYIAPELGYGDLDIPNIPAGSTLIFEIELVDVLKASAQAPVAKPEQQSAEAGN